jgi:hypothetical protein
VASGHLTDPKKTDSQYSGVVSLRSMQIAIVARELTNLFIMVGNNSSAYLDAFTVEKACSLAGTEFGPLSEHLWNIARALYGLRTSGSRWHDQFADIMRLIGFHLPRHYGCMNALLSMNMFMSMLMALRSLAREQINSLILSSINMAQIERFWSPTHQLSGDCYC